jgi:hypothetical protein
MVCALWLAGVAVSGSPMALAQGRPDPATRLAAQRDAMKALSFMDGEWRGTAWTLLPTGERHTITQTERIGSFLDGAVKVIEGRGYEPDGKVGFNALAIVSYDPDKKAYTMQSHAQGWAGTFVLTPTENGFVWEIPAGPNTMRYTATFKDGVWSEVGDRIAPGKEPVRFLEMSLKRIGDSTWPAAGAVSAQ